MRLVAGQSFIGNAPPFFVFEIDDVGLSAFREGSRDPALDRRDEKRETDGVGDETGQRQQQPAEHGQDTLRAGFD